MKFAKVVVARTHMNENGLLMNFVTTIPDTRTPEEVFAHMGLKGRVESYTVSPCMPLPIALEYSYQVQRELGLHK